MNFFKPLGKVWMILKFISHGSYFSMTTFHTAKRIFFRQIVACKVVVQEIRREDHRQNSSIFDHFVMKLC